MILHAYWQKYKCHCYKACICSANDSFDSLITGVQLLVTLLLGITLGLPCSACNNTTYQHHISLQGCLAPEAVYPLRVLSVSVKFITIQTQTNWTTFASVESVKIWHENSSRNIVPNLNLHEHTHTDKWCGAIGTMHVPCTAEDEMWGVPMLETHVLVTQQEALKAFVSRQDYKPTVLTTKPRKLVTYPQPPWSRCQ